MSSSECVSTAAEGRQRSRVLSPILEKRVYNIMPFFVSGFRLIFWRVLCRYALCLVIARFGRSLNLVPFSCWIPSRFLLDPSLPGPPRSVHPHERQRDELAHPFRLPLVEDPSHHSSEPSSSPWLSPPLSDGALLPVLRRRRLLPVLLLLHGQQQADLRADPPLEALDEAADVGEVAVKAEAVGGAAAAAVAAAAEAEAEAEGAAGGSSATEGEVWTARRGGGGGGQGVEGGGGEVCAGDEREHGGRGLQAALPKLRRTRGQSMHDKCHLKIANARVFPEAFLNTDLVSNLLTAI